MSILLLINRELIVLIKTITQKIIENLKRVLKKFLNFIINSCMALLVEFTIIMGNLFMVITMGIFRANVLSETIQRHRNIRTRWLVIIHNKFFTGDLGKVRMLTENNIISSRQSNCHRIARKILNIYKYFREENPKLKDVAMLITFTNCFTLFWWAFVNYYSPGT